MTDDWDIFQQMATDVFGLFLVEYQMMGMPFKPIDWILCVGIASLLADLFYLVVARGRE